jgi:succinate-semialdehyde dehydrogenase/glutarate-semialdehyde dehydrogenase
VLELGGKDALIVDAGVDPRWAADQAATGAFANAGQICTSVERIYVHADVAAPFVDALSERARTMKVGPGFDAATEMGPLIDERQRAVVHAHVSDAVERGAQLRAGGELPGGTGDGAERGFFYPPTVVVGADDDMTLMREETFGPVASISVVDSFDEALERANAGDYGLAATVLTPSEEHAERAWRELEVGTVKVNAVFGGAPGGSAQPHRQSGMGYGYGPELLDEVTITKVVHVEAAVTLQQR